MSHDTPIPFSSNKTIEERINLILTLLCDKHVEFIVILGLKTVVSWISVFTFDHSVYPQKEIKSISHISKFPLSVFLHTFWIEILLQLGIKKIFINISTN